jgi:hypothetical protein
MSTREISLRIEVAKSRRVIARYGPEVALKRRPARSRALAAYGVDGGFSSGRQLLRSRRVLNSVVEKAGVSANL